MESVLIFLLGLCVGSFINCVVYRLNNRIKKDFSGLRGIFLGRSFCDGCRRRLVWYDNLPVVSFLMLRGRCRFCHSPILWQYPLIELATGFLFLGVFWWVKNWCGETFYFDRNKLVYCYLVISLYCFIGASLVAIFVSDLRYNTIPDEIVYPAMLISFLNAIRSFAGKEGFLAYAIAAAIGAGLFFFILVLLTRGRGMGMGDVKLAGLMGLVLGFPKILVALFLAFLTGAVWGGILVVMGKKKLKSHIPFGPFLVGATLISLVWGNQIFEYYMRILR
jgi:leader peptidase (prepilin peptidase)/N-methyltransferase